MRPTAIVACLAAALFSASGLAAPLASKSVSADGVVAYQDDADPKQFHYIPLRSEVAPQLGIIAFSARYWGIGKQWNSCPEGDTANCYSAVGAVVAGTVAVDISKGQERAIKRAIARASGGKLKEGDVRLAPAKLRDVAIQPTIASNTFEFGEKADQNWPKSFDIGSTVNYSVGTGGSTFAAVVASGDGDSYEVTSNPMFGMNVSGTVEVVGDPWIGEVSCELDKVWKEVRKSVNASVKWGWLDVGNASYDSLWQDLKKSGACTLTLTSGSLDNEQYGMQMFDLMKQMFEEINKQAQGGVGFFKFEPIPEKEAFGLVGQARAMGLLSSLRSVKVNAAYSTQHFKQTITWAQKIKYQGRFKMPVYFGLTMALTCSRATKHMFFDLGATSEPCITQEKVDTFNARVNAERRAKDKALLELFNRYASGQIDDDRYEKGVALLRKMSLSEQLVLGDFGTDHGLGTSGRFVTTRTVDDAIAEFLDEVAR